MLPGAGTADVCRISYLMRQERKKAKVFGRPLVWVVIALFFAIHLSNKRAIPSWQNRSLGCVGVACLAGYASQFTPRCKRSGVGSTVYCTVSLVEDGKLQKMRDAEMAIMGSNKGKTG